MNANELMNHDELVNRFVEANFPNLYMYQKELIKTYLKNNDVKMDASKVPNRMLRSARVPNNNMYGLKAHSISFDEIIPVGEITTNS